MSTDHAHTADQLPEPTLAEVSPGIYAYIQLDGSWGLNNTGFIRAQCVESRTCSTEIARCCVACQPASAEHPVFAQRWSLSLHPRSWSVASSSPTRRYALHSRPTPDSCGPTLLIWTMRRSRCSPGRAADTS